MPNIASVLKDEIARISRKEIKTAFEPVRKATTRLRSDVAELRRQIIDLEKDNRRLRDALGRECPGAATIAPSEPAGKSWISGKGIKGMRKRLGLSQAEFAQLVGVTVKSVNTWEQKPGVLKLHATTRSALLDVRGIGVKEARQRLEQAE